MTNPNDITQIKQLIVTLAKQGRKIVSTWDAGGDQTLCSVFVQNAQGKDELFPETDNKPGQVLVHKIIDELNLPNAGEHYHKGRGEVLLDANQHIVIRFTSKAHIENYDDTEEYQQDLDLPELAANLLPYLNRLSLTIDCDLYNDQTIGGGARIEYMEGDEIALHHQTCYGYKKAIVALLEPYRLLIMQGEGRQLGNVEVTGNMQPDGMVKLVIKKTYYDVNNYEDVTEVLFG